jgi:hypothetical protein
MVSLQYLRLAELRAHVTYVGNSEDSMLVQESPTVLCCARCLSSSHPVLSAYSGQSAISILFACDPTSSAGFCRTRILHTSPWFFAVALLNLERPIFVALGALRGSLSYPVLSRIALRDRLGWHLRRCSFVVGLHVSAQTFPPPDYIPGVRRRGMLMGKDKKKTEPRRAPRATKRRASGIQVVLEVATQGRPGRQGGMTFCLTNWGI